MKNLTKCCCQTVFPLRSKIAAEHGVKHHQNRNSIKADIMSNVKFLILYIILMVPTYFWRFGLIGSAIGGGDDLEEINNAVMMLLLISYVGMALVSYFRGKRSGKKYLFAFPLVGGVFDLILVFIPIVPTVMNIITIVMGMSDAKEAENEPTENIEREEVECPACAELILKKARKCKHCGYELNA